MQDAEDRLVAPSRLPYTGIRGLTHIHTYSPIHTQPPPALKHVMHTALELVSWQVLQRYAIVPAVHTLVHGPPAPCAGSREALKAE